MSTTFLKFCQLTNRVHSLQADNEKTVELLRSLKSGAVSIDDITMTDDGWSYNPTSPDSEKGEDIDLILDADGKVVSVNPSSDPK